MNETTEFYVFCMIVYFVCVCVCVCVCAAFSFINVWKSDTEFAISNRITTPSFLVNGHTFLSSLDVHACIKPTLSWGNLNKCY